MMDIERGLLGACEGNNIELFKFLLTKTSKQTLSYLFCVFVSICKKGYIDFFYEFLNIYDKKKTHVGNLERCGF